MESVWSLSGVESVWSLWGRSARVGVCVESVWSLPGVCLESVWSLSGVCLESVSSLSRVCRPRLVSVVMIRQPFRFHVHTNTGTPLESTYRAVLISILTSNDTYLTFL